MVKSKASHGRIYWGTDRFLDLFGGISLTHFLCGKNIIWLGSFFGIYFLSHSIVLCYAVGHYFLIIPSYSIFALEYSFSFFSFLRSQFYILFINLFISFFFIFQSFSFSFHHIPHYHNYNYIHTHKIKYQFLLIIVMITT